MEEGVTGLMGASEEQRDRKVAGSDFSQKTWWYTTSDLEKQELILPLIRMVSPTYICTDTPTEASL